MERENKIVFVSDELNYFNDDNVFDFIDSSITVGPADTYTYLTPIGEYVYDGSPFYSGWEEYATKNESAYDYGHKTLEECSEKEKKEIKKEYDDYKKAWLEDCKLKEEDLEELDLLHEQFEAIKTLSKNPKNEEAKKIIVDTYEKTGKNVLSFLVGLKTTKEWAKMTNLSANKLCAVFTGYDPAFDSRSLKEDSFERREFYNRLKEMSERNRLLSKMHHSFVYYRYLIDELVNEKKETNESNKGK